MRVVVVYKDQADTSRQVTDYLRDVERQTGKVLETLDPDSAEGAHFCRTYDIVEYPTIIAVDDNGVLQQMWRGLPLPLIGGVAYYA